MTSHGPVVSKKVREWRKLTNEYWLDNLSKFIVLTAHSPNPLFIHMTFVRKGEHLFDYINVAQVVQDEMVAQGWINDDNAYQLVTVFGKFRIDKNNPGVEIRVLKSKPKYEFL